ncbi:SDR family NAD(P)-dependent oxidoreductase [Williamsia deligens]|uniref:SDR family NAD(P)-dependent oxidoreductase n=1 Tax=Williamsia deligens TaxID=321325 RepID=A0ABW3GBC9_9NOCA|nr:SDR family NAD(P)-dependent oxidoreductase [Williamsia deligens]
MVVAGRFTNKHIVITGVTSGIGRAGALRLASEGARLTLTGTNPARIAALRDDIPEAAVVLNDSASRDSGVELARVIDGGVDGLWLNAGRATVAAVDQIAVEDFDSLVATNVRGPFLQLAAIAPMLDDGAAVLVTSSTSPMKQRPARRCTPRRRPR